MFKKLEWLTKAIAWLQIAASPIIIGTIIGALVYLSGPSNNSLFLGVLIAGIGVITGIIWASKIWKTKGTVWFVSRPMASPELNKPENETNKPETEK